jgi:hypothetical protein
MVKYAAVRQRQCCLQHGQRRAQVLKIATFFPRHPGKQIAFPALTAVV